MRYKHDVSKLEEQEVEYTYYYLQDDIIIDSLKIPLFIKHDQLLAVTDDTGELVARQSFDAWGRYGDPNNWQITDHTSHGLSWLYRGYTGHEMLPELHTINMNGRLYDPRIQLPAILSLLPQTTELTAVRMTVSSN